MQMIWRSSVWGHILYQIRQSQIYMTSLDDMPLLTLCQVILLTEKVSQVPFQDGEAMSLLPEGYETAVAMVQIMEGSEVTALQTGDIIKMNGYDDGLIDIPALNFVRVITAMEPDAEGVIWITVSANQRQSTFLEKHRKDVFHVSVMVRENEELAEKLLQQQSAYFEEEP